MLSRPLSPHLQIYKLPLAAIISISHRIMGTIFLASALVIAIMCLGWLVGMNFSWVSALMFSWLGKIKITWLVLGVIFYALAEVRYTIWELYMGMSPTFVNMSNLVIVLSTIAVSMGCWIKIWSGL
jgi:succinate dehydrogenase / fumarate reductase cytochrome b subunit